MHIRRLKSAVRVLACVASVLASLMALLVLGARRRSVVALSLTRRIVRTVQPIMLRTAGSAGSDKALLRHVGRASGRSYETPVLAAPAEDAFVIALPYGMKTDWVRNVLVAGGATLIIDGNSYELDQPEVLPMQDLTGHFAKREQFLHRRLRVEQGIRLQRSGLAASNPG